LGETLRAVTLMEFHGPLSDETLGNYHSFAQHTFVSKHFHCRQKTCRIFWGFEQFSRAISRGAMQLAKQPKTAGFRPISEYECIVPRQPRC